MYLPLMEVKSLLKENDFFPEAEKRPKEALSVSWKKAFYNKSLKRTAGLGLQI